MLAAQFAQFLFVQSSANLATSAGRVQILQPVLAWLAQLSTLMSQ